MKKNRIVIYVLAILLVISVISIGQNIRKTSELERISKNMINRVYSELTYISFNLDGLIQNIEDRKTDYETNLQSLIMISRSLAKLDTTLKWYVQSFSPKGNNMNIYTDPTFDFDFISYTLTSGKGTVNSMTYSGILTDGVISEKEVKYLTLLRDDVNAIITAMVSDINPPQENQNLTTSQIVAILDTFFSTWSFHNENSPYFLLQ